MTTYIAPAAPQSPPSYPHSVLQHTPPEHLSYDVAREVERIEAEVWHDCYRAATAAEVAAAGLSVTERDGAVFMAASRLDVLFFNRVVGLGMAAAADEAMLDEMLAWYAAAGAPRFMVQLSPAARPAVLPAWLQRRRLRHHNNWTKLFRNAAPPAEEVETDLRIAEVSASHADTFGRVVVPCFDWPAPVPSWTARLVGRPGWRFYMAFDGDVPVAGAGLFVSGAAAYFGPAATLPLHRGRGAQQALIARRIRDAAALGCRTLVAETAEDRPDRPVASYRNLRRAGFDVAYVRPNYLFVPGV